MITDDDETTDDEDNEERRKRHKKQRGYAIPKQYHVTNCIVRQDLTGGDLYCVECNVRLTVNREYFLICPECAKVVDITYDNFQIPNACNNSARTTTQKLEDVYSGLGGWNDGWSGNHGDLQGMGGSKNSVKFYERLFYLNEKLAQNSMAGM